METNVTIISDEEKIENAMKFKTEGNGFYKEKNFRKAMGKYHRGLLQLKAVGEDRNLGRIMAMDVDTSKDSKLSPEIKEKVMSLRADCYNNLAACLLQQDTPKYEKVLDYTSKALEDLPASVKAKHRKGVALYHLGRYSEALQTFNQIEPTECTSTTRDYMKKCKVGLQKEDKELQDTYKAMFNNSSEKT